jgi:DNA modification methylase
MNFNDMFQYKDLDMFYCENEKGVLINEDCMKVLKNLDDNCVNLTLTDIPYDGINKSNDAGGLRKLKKGKADEITFDLYNFIEECYRVTNNTMIIFCGQTQFSNIFGYFIDKMNNEKAKISVRQLVWAKTNPSPMNGQFMYLSGCENAVWVKKKGSPFNAHCKSNVLSFPCGRSKLHPTMKNLALIEDLIKDNSNENDIVFDPCAGSSSILYVAKNLNRKYLGVELDNEFFNIGKSLLTKGYEETCKEKNGNK